MHGCIISFLVLLCTFSNVKSLLFHGQTNATSPHNGHSDADVYKQLLHLETVLDSVLMDLASVKQENQRLTQQQKTYELQQKSYEQQQKYFEAEVQDLKLLNINLTEQVKATFLENDARNVDLKNELDLLNSTSTFLAEQNSILQQQNTILEGKLDSLNSTYMLAQQNITKTEDLKRLEKILTFEIEQTVRDREQEIMKNISATVKDLELRDRYLSLSLLDVHNKTAALRTLLSHFEEQQNLTGIEIKKLTLSQNNDMSNLNASLFRLQSRFESNVAFTAGPSQVRPTFTAGQVVVIFDRIVYQVGGGYNPTKGVFTAPKPGLYLIFCTVVANDDKTFWTKIMINGSVKAGVMAYVISSTVHSYQSGSNLVVHQLQVGDRVWIEMHYGTTLYSLFPDTTFSVIMIHGSG